MPQLISLTAAIITNGIMAGLFLAFACAVTPGLRAVDDVTFVLAFQAINRAIPNGWFLLIFFAAPALTIASVALHPLESSDVSVCALLAGASCSVLTFGITVAANVPLNRRLDRESVQSAKDSSTARQRFERRWNRWNLVRTGTSIGALVFLSTSAAM
ncbi:anthrone oxygenase family protein [Gulosibacter sp. ACHW.36C]|uniref:DUF1772 domain-containing protein n=1 Tax=Gulosibacter sediminis TaxID=1729695 RepID=A0ABY4MUZ1_9MICO|nr:DUF1772 domain-containing protein [Gulosibacter sediminis]UQN14240.1 DUF1772 domain-containing protein [Gulosibacter sediminis]